MNVRLCLVKKDILCLSLSSREDAVRGVGCSLCWFDSPGAGKCLGPASTVLSQRCLHHQVKPQHGRHLPPGGVPNYFFPLASSFLQSLVLVILTGKLMRKLFFGQLRAAEFEHLMERSWYAVTETCLAFTVFKWVLRWESKVSTDS